MEAAEADQQKRAIEREFVEAMEDSDFNTATSIAAANRDLDLLHRYFKGELK